MEFWNAILPLAGVVLGAVLTRVGTRRQQAEALRAQAYADYLRAVAASGHARSAEEKCTAARDAADAKARMVVYGSAGVITALARFEEAGAVMHGPGGEAFISAVSSMRASDRRVAQREIELLLLGPTRV
jgi:hypothetical protein